MKNDGMSSERYGGGPIVAAVCICVFIYLSIYFSFFSFLFKWNMWLAGWTVLGGDTEACKLSVWFLVVCVCVSERVCGGIGRDVVHQAKCLTRRARTDGHAVPSAAQTTIWPLRVTWSGVILFFVLLLPPQISLQTMFQDDSVAVRLRLKTFSTKLWV